MSTRDTMASLFSLDGSTAIVTGATGGIGLSVVPALAEMGADIVSLQVPGDPQSSTLKAAIERHGRSFQAFDCNLKSETDIQQTFTRIWEAGIVPDVLLHMAGITHNSPVLETSSETMNNVIDLNVRAPYIISQHFGRRLVSLHHPGKIIHITSMAATLAQEDICVYAASKAFVRQMVRGLSNEWAREGIQVNAVSPGFIQTPMSKHLHENEDFSAYVKGRTSMRRWGMPDDLKGVVAFLASHASDFITGEEIVVDGGVIGR
ncbi:uncharacterized protein HMPREF1541_05307 [Cyphellophora europaea CBS 101466]|uniref:Gluconate 5-dehydrogenase n=1 Tax=Cyphellophora europaea (strain CBS 101466) TaxID=1220924 RepID=W2RRZ7_CYPE1|nr:uncharacterized protein HMPREF1541_05307 [Cyphellophora europaea CBS 101466]ETN39085.1 hypothetical protein HMPREF1541_05307 [Cyphellophora europaea CBS 101466]